MASQLAPEPVRSCLEACNECATEAEGCARQCIEAADQSMVECVRLCLDCAALCRSRVSLMARDSRYYPHPCGLVAAVCEACATECERFDDELMRACPQARRHAAGQSQQLAA